MWSDILWFKFCFHDTAPICIFVLALRTSLLTAHVFLLSLKHFFRPTFDQEAIAKDHSLASFLEKSIHLWLSCRNGLELFTSYIQLVYGVLMQRDRLVPFLVWSEPLALYLPWNLTTPFPNGFLCLRLTQTFWPALSSNSETKWKGKKCTSNELSPMSQTQNTLQIHNLPKDLQVWWY